MNKEDLIKCFLEGCKEKKKWKIGTEHEKFGFRKKDLRPLVFEEIEQILKNLSEKFKWKKIYENGNIVSLERNKASITLEPGGQIELSGAPLENLFETCKEVNLHQTELDQVCKEMDVEFMGMGSLPKWKKSDLRFVPKKRYKIMCEYMPKVGDKGLDMMLRTSTIQANFDFSSESDMVKKFRVGQSLQPLIIALYANSPFIGGKLTRYLSYRSHIWTKTDKNRCGLLPFIYDKDFCFERYVEYLLDVPMYFIIRNKKFIDLTGITFRDYINRNDKKVYNFEPDLSDWKLHATTVFPEVRLKSFLELRSADGGPWSRVCALPAFWTGIFYDEGVLDDVWEMIKKWKFNEIESFYENSRISGFKSTTPDSENMAKFCTKILDLSERGLKRRGHKLGKKDESFFLIPLKKIANSGRSPADFWKKLFLEKWNHNIDMLYKNNYFNAQNLDEKI